VLQAAAAVARPHGGGQLGSFPAPNRVADLPLPVRVAPRADAAPPADAAPHGAAPQGAADDAALVARLAAGDAEALGALYDRHGGACLALARAVVGAADEADDVVAEAFAQLWRTAGRYDPARGSVAAWAVTVTRTRALDHVRARRRRTGAEERAAADVGALNALPATDAPALPLGGTEAPDAGLLRGEAAGRVRRAVAALPAPQRDAILLAFFGGLTHTDVAERLGEPLGTVKTRIRAGLHKLRAALRPLAPGGDL
jgi:RNA polymerase sigma-70 factor (ECF subfamily)